MAPDPDTHRQHAAQRQAIIAEVVDSHTGAPIEEIVDLLRDRMADRGLQPPPGKWLEAVARDASAGRMYVESNEALADSGLDVPSVSTDGGSGDPDQPGGSPGEPSGGGPSLSKMSPSAEGGVVREPDE